VGNAAEKAFAECSFLLDKNRLLLSRTMRAVCGSAKSTVVGKAKVMSYDDIVEAKIKRETKDGGVGTKRGFTWKSSASAPVAAKKSRKDKVDNTRHEIEASRLWDYCSVPQF